ncbi:MAG TPA: hypothetical protein PLD10_21040 [Rhodopila sp.]|nr:hypothetical protein [Rhodopila sp.]
MTYAERIVRWNRWYDDAPPDWRFSIVLWPLLALGAINMWLTIGFGFPFALLVILGILFVLAIRVPHVLGWVRPAGETAPPRFQIEGGGWLRDLNHRYDAMPEARRVWIFPAILLIAGGINMALTIANGFPFGILFLLVLLVLVAIRAPYAAGWFAPPSLSQVPHTGDFPPAQVEQAPVQSIEAVPPPETTPAYHAPFEAVTVPPLPRQTEPDGGAAAAEPDDKPAHRLTDQED